MHLERNYEGGVRGRGFTLLEMLVVTVIIGILAGLLLPALSRAYRQARVLGCPIAYVSDKGVLYLTDPHGQRRIQACSLRATEAFPLWSPNGKYIAFNYFGNTAVVDPVTERVKIIPYLQNALWVGAETLQGGRWNPPGYYILYRVNLRDGVDKVWKNLKEEGKPYGYTCGQFEPYFAGGFILAESDVTYTPRMDIIVRDEHWELSRVIWEDPGKDVADLFPKVDHEGEYVAWTRMRQAGAGEPAFIVAYKHLEDDAQGAFTAVGWDYESMAFCDWTPNGDLLVCIKEEDQFKLAIANLQGKVIEWLPLPGGAAGHHGGAEWRRPRHW